MAEILQIESKKKCYLLHNDILITGIPVMKINAAITALKEGLTDTKSLWANHVFTLDDTFNLEYQKNAGRIILRQAKKRFVEDAYEQADIAAWLIKNLKNRQYRPHNERASEPKNLRFNFVSTLTIALLAGFMAYLKNSGLLPELSMNFSLAKVIAPSYNTGGIIITGAILVILIQFISLTCSFRKQHYKTVYRKNTSSTRLAVNATGTGNGPTGGTKRIRRNDGHYTFAPKTH